MSISLTCACGRKLQVRDEAAGKKVKCPGCQAVLSVPSPETDIDFLPKPPRTCPQCRKEYAPDDAVCGSCGHVFDAGPPVPLQPDRIYTSEKPFDKTPPFPVMVLGMFYRPAYVLEYFRGWAGRPVVLVEIVLLYVASLAAISWVAAAGFAGPRPRTPDAPAPEEQPAFRFPGARRDQGGLIVLKNLPEGRGVEAYNDPEFPEAGQPMTIRFRFCREGKRVPVKVIATVEYSTMDEWEIDEEGELVRKKEGTKSEPRGLSFQSDDAKGWEACRFTPDKSGVYRFEFRTEPATPDEPHTGSVWVQEARKTAPVDAPKALTAATRVIFTLLVSLIALVINAVTINLASKVFGEGGEFLYLAIVLAFVQSIVNLGQLLLLAIGPFVGGDVAFFLGYAFGFWEFVLVILAIMKVYEFDFRSALVTSVIAALIKMWGAVFLAAKILGV